jgi:Fanconi anemia group M protein
MKIMSNQLRVCIDSNEASNRRDILNYFLLNGIETDIQKLDVCDYVVSDRVGVERKDTNDFLGSMKDGRIFQQAKGMAEIYEHPIIILEGGLEKAFKRSMMRPSSVYGALSSLALEYGVNVLPTDSPEATGILLHRLAYREQTKEERPIQLRSLDRSLPLNQQQVYLLSGLPQIGTTLAEELLRVFDNPINIIQELVNAEIHISASGKTKRLLGPLADVRGVGPTIVENTQKLLKESWNQLCGLVEEKR